MSRFRPNIVLQGLEPFAEDRVKVLKIGATILHVVNGCPRCKQSCTDQNTGKVTDEPVETMREFRRMTDNPDNVYFAVNVVPAPGSAGQTIKVGDCVQVIQYGTPEWSDG
jgi:uncharacterized protein